MKLDAAFVIQYANIIFNETFSPERAAELVAEIISLNLIAHSRDSIIPLDDDPTQYLSRLASHRNREHNE